MATKIHEIRIILFCFYFYLKRNIHKNSEKDDESDQYGNVFESFFIHLKEIVFQ